MNPLSGPLNLEDMEPASVYGPRVYGNGSILAPHVDQLPRILSAVLNVAQEGLNQPWPIELYHRDAHQRIQKGDP